MDPKERVWESLKVTHSIHSFHIHFRCVEEGGVDYDKEKAILGISWWSTDYDSVLPLQRAQSSRSWLGTKVLHDTRPGQKSHSILKDLFAEISSHLSLSGIHPGI